MIDFGDKLVFMGEIMASEAIVFGQAFSKKACGARGGVSQKTAFSFDNFSFAPRAVKRKVESG